MPAPTPDAVTAACVEVRRELFDAMAAGETFTPGRAVHEATKRMAARLGVPSLPLTMDTWGATFDDLEAFEPDAPSVAPDYCDHDAGGCVGKPHPTKPDTTKENA